MTNDRYLTELAAELRLHVPDDRAAELTAEIAGHLDASGGNPVEFQSHRRKMFTKPTRLLPAQVRQPIIVIGRKRGLTMAHKPKLRRHIRLLPPALSLQRSSNLPLRLAVPCLQDRTSRHRPV